MLMGAWCIPVLLVSVKLRDDAEPGAVEDEHRVEVVVLAGPDEGGRVRLELAVLAVLAVLRGVVHAAVHRLHVEDALDGVPEEVGVRPHNVLAETGLNHLNSFRHFCREDLV